MGVDSGEGLNQPWLDIEQCKPKPSGAWPPPAALRGTGTPFLVERADEATTLVCLARPEHMLPTATKVVSDKRLEAGRWPAQEVEHGLEVEEVGVLTVRELVA